MSQYPVESKTYLQTSSSGEGHFIWPKETLIDYTFADVLDRVCLEFPDQYAFRYTELWITPTPIRNLEYQNMLTLSAHSQ